MIDDLGMLFLPDLGLLTKILKDKNGLMYVHLPKHGNKKFYLGEEEKKEKK